MKGLILVYLITGIGTIGALRSPLIGLYVYVLLATLRPQFIFGFAGNFANLSVIVGVALLIGWAFKGFGSWRFGRARSVVVAFLLFVFWFVLSATQALKTEGSYLAVQELAKLALPFLAGATLMKDEKDWRTLLWIIVVAQGYVSLEQNINYVFKGYNTAADGFGGSDNNFFGVSLLSVLGPALTLTLASRSWYARCVAAACGVLILHTTLLTFSRGAMVGLIAVGVTAFLIMPKRPKQMAVMIVVVLLAARLVGPELARRYATTFVESEERDTSSESRVDLWRDCLKVAVAYPVFGVGPWNWAVVAENYGWTRGKSAHSVWMESAAELGFPGVTALLMFFGLTVVKLWPIARQRPTDENRYEVGLAAGVVLSVVGFAVAGQFVSARGLEVPYFVVLAGLPLLKAKERATAKASAPARLPAVFPRPQPLNPGLVRSIQKFR